MTVSNTLLASGLEGCCISYFSHCNDEILQETTQEREGLILAFNLRECSPSWLGKHDSSSRKLLSCLYRKCDQTIKVRSAPSDTLPPGRICFLKVTSPSQTVPPAGQEVVKYMSLWGTFHNQATSDMKLRVAPWKCPCGKRLLHQPAANKPLKPLNSHHAVCLRVIIPQQTMR